MREHHDIYVKAEVFLLTDICENFRHVCMKYDCLDPVCYDNLPNSTFTLYLALLLTLSSNYLVLKYVLLLTEDV